MQEVGECGVQLKGKRPIITIHAKKFGVFYSCFKNSCHMYCMSVLYSQRIGQDHNWYLTPEFLKLIPLMNLLNDSWPFRN